MIKKGENKVKIMKSDFVIGVLGGMGTYATINLFEQYAEVFSAEKEWDRPRIIIDNRCTMPSRVRAFLYKENVDKLIAEMSESMEGLFKLGGANTRIILACNTSHLFLPMIYEKSPEIKRTVISIIDECIKAIVNDRIKSVYLLASEGTIESGIYQKALQEQGIDCVTPKESDYILLRNCIEAVKQNKYTKDIEEVFGNLMHMEKIPYILGCTELPILYKKYIKNIGGVKAYDPLYIAINKLKEDYDNE